MLRIADVNEQSLAIPNLMDDDLLKRDEFLNTATTVANTLSKQKKGACYAIDGAWGVGKTYVLDKLDTLFKAATTGPDSIDSQYMVFRYNCWEYDYYEEPLIAIVSAILAQIDAFDGKIEQKLKDRIVHGIKEVGKTLVKYCLNAIATKWGIPDSEEWNKIISSFGDGFTTDLNDQQFDEYISFKKQLKKLQGYIRSLSERITVVFLVDELDRCLPTYAIKVLERLHHLFEGVPNVQVILCIDKTQLKKTVQEIYGADTDVDKYLAKFIQFSLILDKGSTLEEERFNKKFEDYKNMFAPSTKVGTGNVSIFLNELFKGIEIRQRIAIIDKAQLIHLCLEQDDSEKLPTVYMCTELWLSTIHYCGVASYKKCKHFEKYRHYSANSSPSKLCEGVRIIAEEFIIKEISTIDGIVHIKPRSFWGHLAFVDRTLFCDHPKILLLNEGDPIYEKYIQEYWSMLQKIS